MTEYKRTPPPTEELYKLTADEPTPEVIAELLVFNREYQLKGFRYFAYLKLKWEKDNPGKTFPGLCAEVDSVTGIMRALEDQRAWSWGDTRGLGIWCYFLQKERIPNTEETIDVDGEPITVNLKEFFSDYCDLLYERINERLETCDGKIPFLVDIETNRPSDDERNIFPEKHQFLNTHIFSCNAFFQYAMWKKDEAVLAAGWKILEETFRSAHENRFVNHLTQEPSYTHSHGAMMVSAGALVDILKTVTLLENKGDFTYSDIKKVIVSKGRWGMDMFCGYHWNAGRKLFAEYLDPIEKVPFENDNGYVICDPGHTAEGVGFFSELYNWLPKNDTSSFRVNKENAVQLLKEILTFVDDYGYSVKEVMYKNLDLKTLTGVADVATDDGEFRTAPWWNIREAAAAAVRMYVLTKDIRMWQIYKRAFNAAYQNYANANIGGLFLQTLDADTLEELPFHPATGNLDPMHSPRAREREIEALEELLKMQEKGV